MGVLVWWGLSFESRLAALEAVEAANDVDELWLIFDLIAPVIAAVILFIVIVVKTGEPLKWSWGGKTVRMRLHEAPFRRIQSGVKNIEIHLNDKKRQKLRVGDSIIFQLRDSDETIEKDIKALYRFASFEELFQAFPHERGDGNMRQYYSAEDEQKYGALAIEFS